MNARPSVASVLLVVGLAGAMACGGVDTLEATDDFSVERMLAEVPASAADEEPLQIAIADLDGVTELNGLERPAEPDLEDAAAWVGPMTGLPSRGGEPGGDSEFAPVFVVMPRMFSLYLQEIEEFDELVGWSVVDVAAFADSATPPEQFTVVQGDFDEDTLAPTLDDVGNGVVSLGEGEDGEIGEPNPLSQIGVPQRLAQRDGAIAVTPITDFARDWVEGPEETAADDPVLAAVAGALDDAEVPSALLVSLESPDVLTPSDEGVGLDLAVDVVGIGWGVDDEGESEITVVYHLEDASSSDQALDTLEEIYRDGTSVASGRPISDLVRLRGIEADEDLVLVTLEPGREGRPQTILDMLFQRDLPFFLGPS